MKFIFEVEAANITEATKQLMQSLQIQAPVLVSAPKSGSSAEKPIENSTSSVTDVNTQAPASSEDQPKITKEIVRKKWSAIAQSGHQDKLKEVLAKYNAVKLTDIPADKYPDLVQAANDFVAELTKKGDVPKLIVEEFGL